MDYQDIKNRLDRIEAKADKQLDTLVEIKVEQGHIKNDLKYHIARTDTLEDKLLPVYKKYHDIKTVMKFITWVIGFVSMIETIYHIKEVLLLFHKVL